MTTHGEKYWRKETYASSTRSKAIRDACIETMAVLRILTHCPENFLRRKRSHFLATLEHAQSRLVALGISREEMHEGVPLSALKNDPDRAAEKFASKIMDVFKRDISSREALKPLVGEFSRGKVDMSLLGMIHTNIEGGPARLKARLADFRNLSAKASFIPHFFDAFEEVHEKAKALIADATR